MAFPFSQQKIVAFNRFGLRILHLCLILSVALSLIGVGSWSALARGNNKISPTPIAVADQQLAYSHAESQKLLQTDFTARPVFELRQPQLSHSKSVNRIPPSAPAPQLSSFSEMKVLFIENVGQFDENVLFHVYAGAGAIEFMNNSLLVTIVEDTPVDLEADTEFIPRQVQVELSFVDASSNVQIEPFDPLPTQVAYYSGSDPEQWLEDVPAWGGVRYLGLYPGIDVEFSSQHGQIVQRLIADSNADLSDVKLQVQGATPSLEGGDLMLTTEIGDYKTPLLETSIDTNSQPFLNGSIILSPFTMMESIEGSQPMTFWHPNLLYSTYFSENTWEDIAIDQDGAFYLVGSGEPTVMKMRPGNSTPVYVVTVSGSSGNSIKVDPDGNAYFAGTTTGGLATMAAYDNSYNGGEGDLFVSKLDPDGDLLYSTYLGGAGKDGTQGNSHPIAIDDTGLIYLTGITSSTSFPGTQYGYDNTCGGIISCDANNPDGVIAVLDPTEGANGLLYSSYLGGNGIDLGKTVSVNGDGKAYVGGISWEGDFEASYGTCTGSAGSSFLASIDPTKVYTESLVYMACIYAADVWEITTDISGTVYLTGQAFQGLPLTPNALDTAVGGFSDAFLTVLNSEGTGLIYSSFLGGEDTDVGFDIALDQEGAVYITGRTESQFFPTTIGAFDRIGETNGQTNDAFFVKIDISGPFLDYATYIGDSSDQDYGFGLEISEIGLAYIFLITQSENLPVKRGSQPPDILYKNYLLLLNVSGGVPELSKTFSGDDLCFNATYEQTSQPVGGPIDPQTGGYDYSVEDLSIQTSAGPLTFRRTYSSLATGLYSAPLGYGWTHNLDSRLVFSTTVGGLPGFVLFKAHTTNQYLFIENGDGTYRSYPGLCATLERIQVGEVFTYTMKDKTQRQYIFDALGRLKEYRSPQGSSLFYVYDESNPERLTSVIDSSGDRSLELSYFGEGQFEGQLEYVVDHIGRTVGFGYSIETGDLLTVTDVLTNTWTYSYLPDTHLMTEVRNPLQQVVERTDYDSQGRAIRQYDGTDLINPILSLAYNLDGTIVISETVDGQIVTSTQAYSVQRTLTDFADANGGLIQKAYDDNFHPASITDPLSRTTQLAWSLDGLNLLQIENAAGYTTTMSYDDLNNLTLVVDGRGITTTYTYSGTLLIASTDALGHSTVFTYTNVLTDPGLPPRLLKAVQDPLGRVTHYQYNAYGERIAVTDALGRITSYAYDTLGRLKRVTDPFGRSNWTCYNPAGRVVRTVANASSADDSTPQTDPCDAANYQSSADPAYDRITTTIYDAAGRAIATTNPEGLVTRSYYNAAGRVVRVVRNLKNWSIQNPDPPTPEYFTALENLTSQTVYGEGGQVIASIAWIVDSPGMNPGVVISRTTRTYYDALGRPGYVTQNFIGDLEDNEPPAYNPNYPEQNITTRSSYDAVGNLIASQDALGRITRTYYDALNHPFLVVQNLEAWGVYSDTLPLGNCASGATATANLCSQTLYDENGNVIASIDPKGLVTRTYYDALNRPAATVQNLTGWEIGDPDLPPTNLRNETENIVSQTVYDASGSAIASIDPAGVITRSYYDSAGRIYLTVRNLHPQHGISNPDPPACNRDQSGDADPYNICNETIYDEQTGQAIASLDALGRVTRTYYDDLQRPYLTIRNLTVQTYTLGTAPEASLFGNSENVASQTVYDAQGRAFASIEWWVESNPGIYPGEVISRTTRTYYDVLGRAVTLLRNFTGDLQDANPPDYDPAYPDQNVRIDTLYASDGRAIASIEWLADATGEVFTRTARTYFDALGRAVLVVQNLAPEWGIDNPEAPNCGEEPTYKICQETVYNLAGQVTLRKDALGNETGYQYDALGRLVSVTDPLERTTEYYYDLAGNRTDILPPTGVVTATITHFGYDPLGRLTDVWENYRPPLNPDPETNVHTTYSYDVSGNRLSITDGLSHITSFTYDALGRLTSEEDAEENLWMYGYDVAGNRVWMIDPNRQGTQDKIHYSYDGLSRLVSVDYPGNDSDASYAYSALGLRTVMTDTIGLTTWLYDGLSQPITITQPLTGTVGYRYDAQGNRTRLIYPDGKQALYTYDSLGRLATVTDWISQTITYTYNAASWPVNVSLPNGVTITNTYDNAGQLLERVHARDGFLLSSFQYVYNELGNRTLVTETLFTPYHILLPLVMLDDSEEEQMMEGESLSPQLSPQDAYPAPMDAETDSSSNPYPEPLDESEETSFWNGLLNWISELLGWGATTASAHPAMAPLMTTLASQPATIPSGLNQTVIEYSYDPLSRLTAADYSDGSYFHYTHDAVGNRLSEVTEVYTTTYSYDDANRLVSAGGESYTWDANGNLLADGVYTYTFSAVNRLIAVEDELSIVSEFAYNGLGDRVSQESVEETIYYKLDLAAGLTQVLADNDYAYLYGNGRIAQYSETGSEYFLGDALGSVRQLAGPYGEVTLTKTYKPYGETLSRAGYSESAFAYTGEAVDSYIKLIYLRSRYYSPQTGRFISRDTWQGNYTRPPSLNKWLYGNANPINYIDPSGKFSESCQVGGENSRNLTGWLVREMQAQSNQWPVWPGMGMLVVNSNSLLDLATKQLVTAAWNKVVDDSDLTEEGKAWVTGELAVGGGLRVVGYVWWKEMVKDGARWDFKDQIKRNPTGPGESIMLCDNEASCDWYEYSMPGNIFYAYVGRVAGFTEAEIRAGAVYAQLTDPENVPEKNDWQPWWSPIGLDQATDQAAIELGFQMYNLSRGSSDYQTVMEAFRFALKQNKSRLAHNPSPTNFYVAPYPIGLDGPEFPLRFFDGRNGIGFFGGY
jgi:RHS repeat-associated protein